MNWDRSYFFTHQNFILFTLVSVLGVMLYREVSSPMSEDFFATPVMLSHATQRLPASLEGTDGAWAEPYQALTLRWDCRADKILIPSPRVKHVQLEGECLRWIREFRNKKNNYSIDIFQWDKISVTDFFAVELGVNPLQLLLERGAPQGVPSNIELFVPQQSL